MTRGLKNKKSKGAKQHKGHTFAWDNKEVCGTWGTDPLKKRGGKHPQLLLTCKMNTFQKEDTSEIKVNVIQTTFLGHTNIPG